MPHQVGYCCINLTLGKKKISTNRTMRKATFEQRGLRYVSELVLQNVKDLLTIIQWNAQNNVKVFRISSDIFPWGTEYNLEDLPNFTEIYQYLIMAGAYANRSGQRISAHPDHFVKLGSKKDGVIVNSIKDLELHSKIFDLMGLETNHYNPLNIHVGMNYDADTVERWIDSYHRLSDNCKSRLVVENDDKASAFSVKQLFNDIYSRIGIPITFDYFHHEFHPDGLSSEEAAKLAASTWGNITPLFHYSESKNLNENVYGNPRAHADYVYNKIDDYGLTIDIDLEAKAKELALFKYRSLV
jgi:UV DNA damage endonuclease